MKRLLTLSLIALTGCGSYAPDSTVKFDAVNVRFELVDNLPMGINGMARWSGANCTITMRRSRYPACITHEMRHCVEGEWHDKRPNSDDCYVD